MANTKHKEWVMDKQQKMELVMLYGAHVIYLGDRACVFETVEEMLRVARMWVDA